MSREQLAMSVLIYVSFFAYMFLLVAATFPRR